ncbi:inner membrane-spanning protein YciB [Pseudoalteromonas sp. T1lg65]|uniref:inner membrane-spanning protein YciB n=1 Tax=Pseudoalteromonas sp. T1lg65 TaxID=2077101 RepID=UPI003F7909A0
MTAIIEYLPLILFFAVYKFADIFWATGVLILASLIQMTHQYIKHKKVSRRHWVFFAVAVVLGGLTIAFQDEHYIMWKATIVYGLTGAALLVSRYFFNKNLVKSALEGVLKQVAEKENAELAIELPEKDCDQLNLFWAGLLFFISGLNLYIAYNFSLDFWVNFKVFGFITITFLAIIYTLFKVHKYFPEDEAQS